MSENILKKLSLAAPDGFIVGGILRDRALKRFSSDMDIALPSVTQKKLKQIALKINANYFVLDEDTKTYRFTTKKEKMQIDISEFVGKNLDEDISNRDFTINSLAYPLKDISKEKVVFKTTGNLFKLSGLDRKKIIDKTNSVKDIQKKTVSIVSDTSLKSDPLRMLRAFRFAAQFDFKISRKTLNSIKENSKKINLVSGERVQEEILKILSFKNSKKYLELADNAGLLTALLPELEKSRKCAEVYYGKGGVLKHTFLVVDRIEFLLKNLKKIFPKFYTHLSSWKEKENILKLTALLHDIAKPKTAKMMKGRLRFFYHESEGAKLAEIILKNWRFSRVNTRLITSVIKNHLRIGNLASNPIVTYRAVYRFFKDGENFSIALLLLCWADYVSYISEKEFLKLLPKTFEKPFAIKAGGLEREGKQKTLRHLQVINFMLHLYFKEKPKILPKRILSGNDVMRILKIKSSPKVGEILEKVRLAQVEGKIKNKKTAVDFVKNIKI